MTVTVFSLANDPRPVRCPPKHKEPGFSLWHHLKQGLEPVINEQGRETQNLVIDYLVQKSKKMITGGDGRCDSPGYLAERGSCQIIGLAVSQVRTVQRKLFCPAHQCIRYYLHFPHLLSAFLSKYVSQ